MRSVLGVDLGGTAVKAGVVAEDGAVLSSVVGRSEEGAGVDAWLRAGLAAATAALDEAPGAAPRAVGLGVPGAVDATRGVLVDLVERLDSGGGIDLTGPFGELGVPVAVENDARAALAAERRWGGHDDPSNLVVLTLGTGVGSAAVVDGRVPAGDAVLGANQLGHLTVVLEGDRCVCGNRGCLETVAAASALVRAANQLGVPAADAAAVFAAEDVGDERASAAIDRFVSAVAAGVVNAIHAYQPRTVVLTGGVLARAGRLVPRVEALVAERAWTLPRGRVAVRASRLGAHAGARAGAAVAFALLEKDSTNPAA